MGNIFAKYTERDSQLTQEQVTALQQKNQRLEIINKRLRNEISEMNKINTVNTINKTNNNNNNNKNQIKIINKPKINQEGINQIVENYLQDENINCGYIPDYIEKKIYKNILNMVVGIISETLENSRLQFLGQDIGSNIN